MSDSIPSDLSIHTQKYRVIIEYTNGVSIQKSVHECNEVKIKHNWENSPYCYIHTDLAFSAHGWKWHGTELDADRIVSITIEPTHLRDITPQRHFDESGEYCLQNGVWYKLDAKPETRKYKESKKR